MLLQTGRELFMDDKPNIRDTLLFRMATSEEFLEPLRAFQVKRLYANIQNDHVVPLGTGGILDDEDVEACKRLIESKKNTSSTRGVVHTVTSFPGHKPAYTFHPKHSIRYQSASYLMEMIQGLDSVGWEKHLVYFPAISSIFLPYPSAHNKVLAVTKCHEPFDSWLGFSEGKGLVDDMIKWIESLHQEQKDEEDVSNNAQDNSTFFMGNEEIEIISNE